MKVRKDRKHKNPSEPKTVYKTSEKRIKASYIRAYDKAREAREEIVKYYGGDKGLSAKLNINLHTVKMWRARSIAIPEVQAYRIASLGDFSITHIRPDLI